MYMIQRVSQNTVNILKWHYFKRLCSNTAWMSQSTFFGSGSTKGSHIVDGRMLLAPKATHQAPEFKITMYRDLSEQVWYNCEWCWGRKQAASTTITRAKDARYTPLCCHLSMEKELSEKECEGSIYRMLLIYKNTNTWFMI